MTDDVHVRPVQIQADGVLLDGDLAEPRDARGVVLFAHGSGSSRHSPRNRRVAEALNRSGFATLLMDLLTSDEEEVDSRTGELRFDIDRLSARLTAAVDWLGENQVTAAAPVLLFGASTGAAAALRTAADRGDRVLGVVSRGGRPDLAGDALDRLTVPTLLIVGGNDPTVLRMNEQAARSIEAGGGRAEVAVVPGATHLFEEPGALDAVVERTIAQAERWV